MFVRSEALAAIAASDADWEEKSISAVPDLAIEVISPIDRFAKVVKKIERYLADDARMAWLVDPDNRIVTLYMQGSNPQTRLGEDDILSGGEVILGYEILISALFG